MLIYEILPSEALDEEKKSVTGLLEQAGIVTRFVTPSSMSFLTSMRIATECKKTVPDAVVCHRLKDAVGAISARELVKSRNGNFRIVYLVNPKDPLPKRISPAIQSGIDCWVFPDINSRNRYSTLLSLGTDNSAILEPTTIAAPIESIDNDRKIIVRVGPIDDTTTLADTIDVMLDRLPSAEYELRVLGTGQARYVMPLVKRARANGLNITWLGEEYDLEKELAAAGAILVADRNLLSAVELRAMANELPILSTKDDINKFMSQNYDGELRKISSTNWKDSHRPEVYIERLKRIIKP